MEQQHDTQEYQVASIGFGNSWAQPYLKDKLENL